MGVGTVPTEENLADALTKGVESETLKFHFQGVVADIRRDRYRIAPATEVETSEEEKSKSEE